MKSAIVFSIFNVKVFFFLSAARDLEDRFDFSNSILRALKNHKYMRKEISNFGGQNNLTSFIQENIEHFFIEISMFGRQ